MNAKVLFYVFIGIFVATAVITLLGIIHVFNIEKDYLSKLFSTLIVEVVGGVINLFTIVFLKKTEKVKLRFEIKDLYYDVNAVSTFKCTAKLRNSIDGKETLLPCSLYHDNFGLCSDVTITNYKQTLSVTLEIQGKKYQGSDWLETRGIKLIQIV